MGDGGRVGGGGDGAGGRGVLRVRGGAVLPVADGAGGGGGGDDVSIRDWVSVVSGKKIKFATWRSSVHVALGIELG